jgi:hypothetical protein
MRKYAKISPYMRRPLVVYDFATATLNFLLYKENFILFFISKATVGTGNVLLAYIQLFNTLGLKLEEK